MTDEDLRELLPCWVEEHSGGDEESWTLVVKTQDGRRIRITVRRCDVFLIEVMEKTAEFAASDG